MVLVYAVAAFIGALAITAITQSQSHSWLMAVGLFIAGGAVGSLVFAGYLFMCSLLHRD